MKKLIIPVFLLLFLLNVYTFISNINLGDKITFYEKETKRLSQENQDLETKVFAVDSLKYASSLAETLQFTKKAQPVYLDNLKYAYNQ